MSVLNGLESGQEKLQHWKRREFVRIVLSNASSASLSPSLCPWGLGEMGKRRSLINLLHDFSHQLNTCLDSYIETNIPAFKNDENTLNILRSGIWSFLEVQKIDFRLGQSPNQL